MSIHDDDVGAQLACTGDRLIAVFRLADAPVLGGLVVGGGQGEDADGSGTIRQDGASSGRGDDLPLDDEVRGHRDGGIGPPERLNVADGNEGNVGGGRREGRGHEGDKLIHQCHCGELCHKWGKGASLHAAKFMV